MIQYKKRFKETFTKKNIALFLLLVAFCLINFLGCVTNQNKYIGTIYLYGEQHGEEKIILEELHLWQNYYQKGFRHLFLELPYYTAEYLNIWLQENDNTILEDIYNDWAGTAFYNQHMFDFFVTIKRSCPQTVFHGTDVGHQYQSTGKRFLHYLQSKNKQSTNAYKRAQQIIEQGISYYLEKDDSKKRAYREQMLVENFIYELRGVNNADIMGIYGTAHTNINLFSNGIAGNMATQLNSQKYNIISKDLSMLAKQKTPIRVDTIQLGNKNYTANYYGVQDITGFKNFLYREFWQLKDAYIDLKDCAKTGDVLPYNNYPMNIETAQAYLVEYTKVDGAKIKLIYLANGNMWNGMPITENIAIQQ